ncbi:hypothetical protein WA016_06372 [Myxococcus stipitatus]
MALLSLNEVEHCCGLGLDGWARIPLTILVDYFSFLVQVTKQFAEFVCRFAP